MVLLLKSVPLIDSMTWVERFPVEITCMETITLEWKDVKEKQGIKIHEELH